ncbi:MAG TPA: Uma2 family endonuclease [Allocoleopsis sp.]
MTISLLEKPPEQDLLKNNITWQQFQEIKAVFEHISYVKLYYYQGTLEIVTISKLHEVIKSMIALLLGQYFLLKQIEFFPSGSYTQKIENIVECEADLSYCFETDKETPDLVIEIAITSGGKGKLTKYQLLNVPEVWIWQNNNITIYQLTDKGKNKHYTQVLKSGFLPELNLELLQRCVLMSSKLAAITEFNQAIL